MFFNRSLWIQLAMLFSLNACGVSGGHSGAEITYLNFVLVANQGSDDLSVYKLNTTNGALTTLETYAVGSNPQGVVASTDGHFAFVANQGSSTLTRFAVDLNTGELSGGTTLSVESGPSALALHPDLPYLFVAHATAEAVSTYRMDPGTGDLNWLGKISLSGGSAPAALAVDPIQGVLYCLNRGLNLIQSFSIDSASGLLTSRGSATTGTYPTGLSISADGQWVFVSNFGEGTVSVFQSAGGVLSPVGSPTTTGSGPKAIVQTPGGNFLYTINSTANTISPLTINGVTGNLTPGSPFSMDSGGSAAWMDPDGRYLLVANSGFDNEVSVFSLNSTTGNLTQITTRSAGTSPGAIAVARIRNPD